jgi:hypothetical protein
MPLLPEPVASTLDTWEDWSEDVESLMSVVEVFVLLPSRISGIVAITGGIVGLCKSSSNCVAVD